MASYKPEAALLKDKAIIVTGAGRGVGAACAQTAAELGALVLVADVDRTAAEAAAAQIRRAGGKAHGIATDVADWRQAEAMVETCVAAFGRVDGLVNNAGLFEMGSLEELRPDSLRRILSVNVEGAAYCAHHAARHMATQGSGAIVNIISGAQMGIPLMGSYGASKGALASFTYVWAMELGPQGVRVNAVSPLAQTRMVDTTNAYLDERAIARFPRQPPPAAANAPAICFLLSDAAAAINGQVIRTEGSQLSLVSHPAICWPPLERSAWTVSEVIDAFREDLGGRTLPIGVAALEVRPAGASGSAFW